MVADRLGFVEAKKREEDGERQTMVAETYLRVTLLIGRRIWQGLRRSEKGQG